MHYWVVADYSPFGTWRNPPIIVREFDGRWGWLALLRAWWFAQTHVRAHAYGKAFILNHPPPAIGSCRSLAD